MKAQEVLHLIQSQSNRIEPYQHVNLRKPTYGLSYPQMKEISKQISDLNQFLETNQLQFYELEVIHTMIIGKIKEIDVAIKYFIEYCYQAKEWSLVDSLCQRFVIAKKHPEIVFETIKECALSDDEYVQRCVAVMCLSHFLNDDYIEEVQRILLSLSNEGYYTQMAVAWAIATMMVRYPHHAFELLNSNHLQKWTKLKAIQKIQESFRISIEDKHNAKLLKNL
jgi:3-methyladenine DNA glycosylase AlkD